MPRPETRDEELSSQHCVWMPALLFTETPEPPAASPEVLGHIGFVDAASTKPESAHFRPDRFVPQ
jgi:hypothetical protein